MQKYKLSQYKVNSINSYIVIILHNKSKGSLLVIYVFTTIEPTSTLSFLMPLLKLQDNWLLLQILMSDNKVPKAGKLKW